MDIILCLVLFVMAMMVITAVRIRLVYKYQIRALEKTRRKARAAINFLDADWEKYYTKLDSYGTYNKMMLDVRKWTYRQFYPDL